MLTLGDDRGRWWRPRPLARGLLLAALLISGCSSAPARGDDHASQPGSRGEPSRSEPAPATPPGATPATAPEVGPAVSGTAPPRAASARPEPTAGAPPSAAAARLLADRPYQLLRPSSVAPGAQVPVVIYLHGLGSSGRQLLATLELQTFADRKQVFIAAPDGSRDSLGRRFWNAAPACCDFDASGVDDVAYLRAVIDDLLHREPIDPKRVYLVGYSNGGFMAYRLACELDRRFAAIAVFSGAEPVDAACAATGPVSVLHVHGDADRVVRYQGGRVLSLKDRAPHRGAPATVAAWAARNHCDGSLQTLSAGTRRVSDKATTIQRHPCPGGAVELWTVHGGGHLIGMSRPDIEATFHFLLSHPQP